MREFHCSREVATLGLSFFIFGLGESNDSLVLAIFADLGIYRCRTIVPKSPI